MDLLDELPWEVLVMRDQLPVRFRDVDLPENRAEPLTSKDLLDTVMALNDLTPPKQAQSNMHNSPVVINLRVRIQESDILRDPRGKQHVPGLLVPVMDTRNIIECLVLLTCGGELACRWPCWRVSHA